MPPDVCHGRRNVRPSAEERAFCLLDVVDVEPLADALGAGGSPKRFRLALCPCALALQIAISAAKLDHVSIGRVGDMCGGAVGRAESRCAALTRLNSDFASRRPGHREKDGPWKPWYAA